MYYNSSCIFSLSLLRWRGSMFNAPFVLEYEQFRSEDPRIRRVQRDGFINVNGKNMEVMLDADAPYGKCLVPTLERVDSSGLYLRRKNSKNSDYDSECSPKSSCDSTVDRVLSGCSSYAISYAPSTPASVEPKETTRKFRHCALERAQVVSSAFFELRAYGGVSSETTSRLNSTSQNHA